MGPVFSKALTSVVDPGVEFDHYRPTNNLLQEIVGILPPAHCSDRTLSATIYSIIKRPSIQKNYNKVRARIKLSDKQ